MTQRESGCFYPLAGADDTGLCHPGERGGRGDQAFRVTRAIARGGSSCTIPVCMEFSGSYSRFHKSGSHSLLQDRTGLFYSCKRDFDLFLSLEKHFMLPLRDTGIQNENAKACSF